VRAAGAPAHPPIVRRSCLVLTPIVAMLLLPPALAIAGEKWAPILPDEKAVTQSAVDPDAGAEVLLWTIHIEDEFSGLSIHTVVRHEIRTKVFNERGVEEAAKVEITHLHGVHVTDVAARTVRPDGSVVELAKGQIFDRTAAKGAGVKVEVKAFAFPAVTPGCILDYRWTEIHHMDDAPFVYLELQREHPVRRTELYLKPLPLGGTGYNFKMRTFNMKVPLFEDSGDYQKAVLPPVAARRDEPYMPPEHQVSPLAVLYYTFGDDPGPEDLWKSYATSILKTSEPAMKADASVKAMAVEITAHASTPEAKADSLYDWCRTHVDYVTDDRLGLSETQRSKEPKNRTPAETLKRRRGTVIDLDYLLVAMCRSVGLGARLAAVADRSEVFFDPRLGLPGLLDSYCVAVLAGTGWRFYDPSRRWLPAGLLAWTMEGEDALLLDEDNPQFVKTPLAPPESSLCARSAHLRLDADGSVEGLLRTECSGHRGAERHEEYDELSPEARAEHCRTNFLMTSREAVLADFHVDGADDPMQRVVEHATIKIPGYAQAVGDRLLVPLSFFEWKASPLFTAATRRYPIYFQYPWAMSDTVTIDLPQGYEIEALPDIEPLTAKGVTRYQCASMASTDGRSVVFLRSFAFGESESIFFPADQYAGIKKVFDGVRQRDEVTLSLKRRP
jgi:transglutaminase-like putative cysteine protease